MATTEATIEGALFARMLAMDTALRIAGISGDQFTPNAGETYLRVEHIPNKTDRLGVSTGMTRRKGILQVTVVGPKVGKNPIDLTEEAGQVAAWFPEDLTLWGGTKRIRITKTPTVEGRIDADPWVNVPVTIEYETL